MTDPNLAHSSSLLQGPPVIDLSARAKWKLTGADRIRYLNGQTTNDIIKLPEGHACRAAILDAKGRFQGEIMVAKSAEALWIDGPAELREPLGLRLERYIIADDATLEDVTDRWNLLHFRPPPTVSDDMAFASSRYLEPGTDCWLPATSPLPPASPEAEAEPLRILRLLPAWDREIDPSTLVPEVLYDRLGTSYTKGCYIGQEVVARLKSIGRVNRELRLLRTSTAPTREPPFDLERDGAPAGRLTSLATDPTTGTAIALGIIARAHLDPGTRLVGGETTWEVQALPGFDISATPG
ncbi:MAG: aminomethyltransferase [Candidatus Methylacidiphilales bacterium]